MPNFYSDVDKSTWMYQPNFTRSRARYRGQRESYKINTEMYQVLYDIRKLYEKFDTLDTIIDTNLSLTDEDSNGAYFPTVIGYPAATAVAINGLDDLVVRLEHLYRRISSLVIIRSDSLNYPDFDNYPNFDNYPS